MSEPEEVQDRGKKRLQSSAQQILVHQFLYKKQQAKEQGIPFKKTECIIIMSRENGVGFDTILKIINNHDRRIKLVTPGKKRVKKCPVTGVDNFTKEAIARFIYDKLHKGERVTAAIVHEHIKNNKETFLFQGSLVSLRKIMKEIGFKWSKEDSLMYVRESEEIILKRIHFLREYMNNMKSENPKPVVFLDETWIFMNGSATHSWSKPGKDKKGFVRGIMKRQAEGGRLVILHAGTKDGWIPGADLLFASNLKKGQDYHGAMNSETFQKWVQTQLLPGLRNLGPSIIILDNASYHNKLSEQQPTTKWNRPQLLSWLGQNEISVNPKAKVKELQSICLRNKSKLKSYVVDEMLRTEGHSVLRLPPYHSTFNAIELVWSVTKGYYNKNVASYAGHGLDRARAVWKDALDRVTSEMWKKEVEHTEKIIMKYYDEEVGSAPEVDEIVINLQESEEEEEEDDEEEELAVPLEPMPSTSK